MMPTISTLIASAWQRYREPPVLNDVIFWLIILPGLGISIAERLGGQNSQSYWPDYFPPESAWWIFFIATVLCNILLMWGTACVLVAGRDHAEAKKLTFVQLRRMALPFIWPILLTEILRFCLIFLWSVLLIVPGILYMLRTMLVEPVIVSEGLAYRPALRRALELVKGRTGEIAWALIGSSILIFFPISIVLGFVEGFIGLGDPRLLAVSDALQALVVGVTTALYVLVLMAVYESAKHQKKTAP